MFFLNKEERPFQMHNYQLKEPIGNRHVVFFLYYAKWGQM